MSVVVAIKQNNNIYIGADSQVTRYQTKGTLTNPNNFKVWKVKGVDHCLMAHVGSVKDACAIRTIENLVREIDVIHDDIDFDYVVNRIEPIIRDELIDHKCIKEDDPYGTLESRFLFAYKDKLFSITYGAVIEIDDFIAIGSGDCEAFGSLITTEGIKDPKERIVKAIKASATQNVYVGFPVVIFDTESTDYDIIDDDNDYQGKTQKSQK